MTKKYKVIPIYKNENSRIPTKYIAIKKHRKTRKNLFLVVNFKDHKVSVKKLKVDMNKYNLKKYIKRTIRNILFKTYLDNKINRL